MHIWAAFVIHGLIVSACAGGLCLGGWVEVEGCVVCSVIMYGWDEVRDVLCGRGMEGERKINSKRKRKRKRSRQD